MPRMVFTDRSVRALPVPSKDDRPNEVQYFEKLKRGLSLSLYVSYGGSKTWRAVFYVAAQPRSRGLGTYPKLSVAEARKKAFQFDPETAVASTEGGTFEKVAIDWISDHVDKKRLRSKREIERQLKVYVYPNWAKRPIFEINRLDVNNLLRDIERKHGAPQADAVLATIRGIMTWFAVQDHRYTPAVVPKMKRDKREAHEKARKRILSDDEIRAVWKACDELGTYGALVKVLLLTGQRLSKVSTMRWTDLSDGVWTIHSEAREKGHAGKIKLPQLALETIAKQPRIAGNPFVFPGSAQGRKTSGKKALGPPSLNSFSQRKTELDQKLPKGMIPWVLHDLRRTSRSLMSRLAISRDIAERTLGHAIVGVEAVYDRHSYFDEKSDALRRLAELISLILNSPEAINVVTLRGGQHPQT